MGTRPLANIGKWAAMTAAISAMLFLSCAGCANQDVENDQATGDVIMVNHEWGALKEVIVGIGEDIVVPDYCEGFRTLEPQYAEFSKRYGGMSLAEVDPESQEKIVEQIEGLVRVLEERGIVVHRVHPLQPEEEKYLEYVQGGCVLIYARDPVIVIGDRVIEASLRYPFRRKERYSMRPVLEQALKEKEGRTVSVPPASPHGDETGPFLEGGDVLLNGYDIYVGHSGNASNEAGMRWLRDYLGPDYRVHLVPLSEEFLHLDCALSLVRPGLGIICRDAFTAGLPESLQDWDFVEITEDEARKLGANVFVVDDETVIVDSQHHRIAEELRRRGVEVMEIPYDEVATLGGGFRCTHHPLVRESTLEQAGGSGPEIGLE